MIWVFGIVFLTLVAIFAIWLFSNSNKNRQLFRKLTRKKRIIYGVFGMLLSFGSALGALTIATLVKDWKQPSVFPLTGILIFMLIFVGLQVLSMLSFVSLAMDSETPSDPKRP